MVNLMMKPGLRRGQLVKWKDDRGFGFIQPLDGSPEVFLHISELKDATRRPSIGDTIYYHLGPDKNNKVQACNAFILGARNKPASSSSSKSISHAGNKYPFPIWELLLLSILPLVGSIHFAWKTTNPIPLILYPLMSLLTFGLYADDKSRAQRGKRRTPEKTLHLFELAGGWVGGFIAQKILRHKSVKTSYQIEFWVIVTLHIAFWVDWLFLGGALVKGLIFLLSNLRK
jgi:uncharacterized membrane protein YsdA (DUF1294 family)/cold shock CspA family protein